MRLGTLERRNAAATRLASVDWNFPRSEGTAVTHRLHPWPARFVPELPGSAIDLLTEPDDVVLDPFCGCGTTAIEAWLRGRRFAVADGNELAALITRAKCWPPAAEERAEIHAWASTLKPQSDPARLRLYLPAIPNLFYWFSEPVATQLAYLLHEIDRIGIASAFLKVVVSSIINAVSFQESETRYRRVAREVSSRHVIDRFRSQLNRALAMAAETDHLPIAKGSVACRDARESSEVCDAAALAVFSPPYPNAFDYHLYHRFRMFWLGFDPREAKRSEIGAHLRYQPDGRQWLEDMTLVFEQMRPNLTSGAYVVCVVGDGLIRGHLVPSADLLWSRIPELGYEPIARYRRGIPTTRKSFKTSDGRLLTEHVLVLGRT